MSTTEIINEINSLPVNKRLVIIEKALYSIRHEETKNNLKEAADKLLNDYKSDKELTAFSELDFEDFYEAR